MKNMYALANIKKVKWGVLEENQPISLYPVMYPGWCGVVENTWKILGKRQENASCIHRKDHGVIFIDHKEWTELGRFALRKILRTPRWGFWLNKKILTLSDELVQFTTSKIFLADLSKKSNSELFALYKEYDRKHSRLYNHAIIPVFLDLYKPHLTSYVVEYLTRQVKKVAFSKTAKECFSLLTVPQKFSQVQLEELSLLRIANQITKVRKRRPFSKKKLSKRYTQQLQKHIDRNKYLGYNWEGPPLPDTYFWRRLKEFVEDTTSPEERIKTIVNEKQRAQRIHDSLIQDLRIDSKHRKMIDITQGFMYSKEYRKMNLVQSYYKLEPLLKEISKRLKISIAKMRNCLLVEVGEMLVHNASKPKDLNKRMKGCFFVVIQGKLPGKVFTGKIFTEMKKYLLKKEDLTEVNYFHGQTASLGKAQGIVRIVNTIRDAKKVKKGNILVSQMTNPDLVPAMKKAGAILTDLGGVTCHAAIVSRELKIPCVIGTKVATKVLKDGDRVEVDANKGDIRKI
ncbi:PEP-utilizing enzyme [Patescibacteria group bacterium]